MTMLKSVMIIKFTAWAMVGKVGDKTLQNATRKLRVVRVGLR